MKLLGLEMNFGQNITMIVCGFAWRNKKHVKTIKKYVYIQFGPETKTYHKAQNRTVV